MRWCSNKGIKLCSGVAEWPRGLRHASVALPSWRGFRQKDVKKAKKMEEKTLQNAWAK